ncbi:hypothetical protein ACH0AH_06930 [Microbacterium paludicola]|uniref:hypothetical protein n=1 Tax=Microbacterium paludicola TaxID=300019 RepID=UPI00387A3D62
MANLRPLLILIPAIVVAASAGCAASPAAERAASTPVASTPAPAPAAASGPPQTALEDPEDIRKRMAAIDPMEGIVAKATFEHYLESLRAFYMDEPGALEQLRAIASEDVIAQAEEDLAAIRAKGLQVRAADRLDDLIVHLAAPPSHVLAFVCRDLAAMDLVYESGEPAPIPAGGSILAQEVRLVNDPDSDGFIVDGMWPAPEFVGC